MRRRRIDFETGMSMNFIEMLLSEKLKDRNPTLDILGSDRKVLQIACQDIVNYLKVHWQLVGKDTSDCEIVENLEKHYNDNRDELELFLDIWTGMWLRKWKERVKLLIGNEGSNRWNKASKSLANGEPLWRRLTNRKELEEVVTLTLIRSGEICGTSILAENLLKMELGEKRKKPFNDKEQVIVLVNNTLRKARELAHSQGPLIYVKVDKAYYQSTR